MVSFVSSCTSSGSETAGMSPLSRRARSSVTSPVPHSRAAVAASGSGRRLARAPPAAAQQEAGGDLVPAVQVEQRVGGEPPGGPVPLAEVAGELDRFLVQICA